MPYSRRLSRVPDVLACSHLFRLIFFTASVMFVGIMPVMAAEHTLNPGDPIQRNITDASDGDIIILNPGTYYEHDITITRNITIRANSSAGGIAANTFIDGENAHRIFNNSGGYTINDHSYYLTIDNLTLRNGNAENSSPWAGYGGAILLSKFGGKVNITSSIIDNCTASYGGAVAVVAPAPCCSTLNVGVHSSTITNCSATRGSVLYTQFSDATIHYSRIYNNTGTAVYKDTRIMVGPDEYIVDASHNWWGSNDNPSSQLYDAAYHPWLVLNVIATPSSVATGETAMIEANFTYDSDEQFIDPSLVRFPDGIPVTYSTASGSIQPSDGTMMDGVNTTMFTSAGDGRVIVEAAVDNQTISTGDDITAPRVVSISSSSGPSTGGVPVTITGLRFTSVNGVSFGNTPATSYTVDSDTQISAVAPAHTAGIVHVTVNGDGGSCIPSVNDTFMYIGLPGSEVAINPGDSIHAAMEYAGNDSTIILNPGVYREHDIIVTGNITLRANTSAGGNAANTIIDGEYAGRILNDYRGYSLTVDNLSIANGSLYFYGGAILVSGDGNATITSSSFANSAAVTYGGGAIVAMCFLPFENCTPRATIISSTFSNCTSNSGSVLLADGNSSITYSRFININNFDELVTGFGGTNLNATNNWWGTNDDPSGFVSGSVTTSPWLVLNITATPSNITNNQNSVIRANITKNSDGADTIHGGVFIPYRGIVTFSMTRGSGSPVIHAVSSMTEGSAKATLMNPDEGLWNVSATVDGVTVSTNVTVSEGAGTLSGVGVFQPSATRFYLRNGTGTTTITFGSGTDTPITGDWNGDGLFDVGVYRPSNTKFYLRNGSVTTTIVFGASGDTPVTGDWNGDGLWDIGVYRNATSRFYLKNGSVTTGIVFGSRGDTPITGDWNGDGLWDVGVFRNTSTRFYLRNGSTTTKVTFGATTDAPISGDWNGDGLYDVGVFRPTNNKFYLRNGSVTTSIVFGSSGDTPVTGIWN